jgi:hypothetical protein
MMIGLLLDTLKPGIHYVRKRWIRGFMAFKSARHEPTVMLMVPCDLSPVSGNERPAGVHSLNGRAL